MLFLGSVYLGTSLPVHLRGSPGQAIPGDGGCFRFWTCFSGQDSSTEVRPVNLAGITVPMTSWKTWKTWDLKLFTTDFDLAFTDEAFYLCMLNVELVWIVLHTCGYCVQYPSSYHISFLGQILPAGSQWDGEDCQADPRRGSASGIGGQSRSACHPQRGIWFPAVCVCFCFFPLHLSAVSHQILTARQSVRIEFMRFIEEKFVKRKNKFN